LINAVLTLKYLAGSLNVHDLELINSWLASTRVNGFSDKASK
jgi:outer membrane protein